MELSAYRCMWVFTMFDLPVDTKAARRQYTRFRKRLLKDGFTRLQYSVYIRHSSSVENAAVHIARVENGVPPDGEVRVIVLTDKQFEKMRTFWGKTRKNPPKAPRQLTFF
jgi:CRISPR-associated protein Cas2